MEIISNFKSQKQKVKSRKSKVESRKSKVKSRKSKISNNIIFVLESASPSPYLADGVDYSI